VALRRLVELIAPPLCAACGASECRLEPLCAACRGELRWQTDTIELAGIPLWAPVAYEGPARGLVRALKFRGATGAAEAMASQIAANAPPGVLDRGRLVPVPLHPSRLRKRGFNQAGRLAAAVARRTGLLVADCLTRTGPSATQVGRDRSERLSAPLGTVLARGSAEVPSRAILIDDVVTTGGTLAACGAALLEAGAQTVTAVAYARTPGR